MPNQGYTIGRDVAIDIIGPNGPLRFKVRTGFSSRPVYDKVKVKRADGITDHLNNPDGWEGDFDFERQGDEIDAYFAQLEEDWHQGRDTLPVQITETITEKNGAVSQYRYLNVALTYDNAGEKSGTGTVKQKIGWNASRRKKVA